MRAFFKHHWLKAAAAVGFFAILVWYYVHFYGFAFSVNSDNAYFLLAGEDILSGNLLLANWRGGFFTALTGDLLAAAILRIFLSRKAVLYLLGPLSYALITGFCFLLMMPAGSKKDLKLVFLCLLPILFVPPALRHPLLTVGMHGIAIVYILLLFFLTERIGSAASPGTKKLLNALLFIFSAAGVLADSFVLVYGVLPLLAGIILRQFRQRSGDELKLIPTLGIAAVVGKTIPEFLNRGGFLQTGSAETAFTPLAELPGYLLNTLRTWLRIFSFIPSEFHWSLPSLPQIAGAAAAIILLLVSVGCIFRFFRTDLITQTLLIAFVFCAGSFTLTTVTHGEQAVRYLSPAFFFGMILFTRQLMQWPPENLKIRAVMLLPFVLFSLGSIETDYLSTPVNNRGYIEISEALRERGLKNGYGTYWETHALSYYSDSQLLVAPVGTAEGRIVPSASASKTDWYETGFNAEFLLVSQNKTYGLNEQNILRTFGPYTEHLTLHETDIYIYDKNISVMLSVTE